MRLPPLSDSEPLPWVEARCGKPPEGRPWVTLSFAQSIDGCIAERGDQPLALSGPDAMRETHRLRAAHDAILVGIGTVLSDDPRLSVRLVKGRQPQPVVLDSMLRFPPTARMLSEPSPNPLLFASRAAPTHPEAALRAAGLEIVRVPPGSDGLVQLGDVLQELRDRGLSSLMVEGGAGIITRFLRRRLVDDLVVTIAPVLVRGGLRAVGEWADEVPQRMTTVRWTRLRQAGRDVVVYGKPTWSNA